MRGSTRSSSTGTVCRRAIDGKQVKLLTRKGLDWTEKFKPIAAALRDLKLGSALIDGEVVVEDEAGRVELHLSAGGP